MRRLVTLLAVALVLLSEAGYFIYLAVGTYRALLSPCPYSGVDPCNGRYLGFYLIPLFAMAGLVVLAAGVSLVVRPGLISWTWALLVQCFFLDVYGLLAVGLLLTDRNHPFAAKVWELILLWWPWVPPLAALVLLLVPGTLRVCFRVPAAAHVKTFVGWR